jgi:hypothetical protein
MCDQESLGTPSESLQGDFGGFNLAQVPYLGVVMLCYVHITLANQIQNCIWLLISHASQSQFLSLHAHLLAQRSSLIYDFDICDLLYITHSDKNLISCLGGQMHK